MNWKTFGIQIVTCNIFDFYVLFTRDLQHKSLVKLYVYFSLTENYKTYWHKPFRQSQIYHNLL